MLPVFNPWVRKIPWGRERQASPVFLPGEFQGLRSLVGCSPWGHKESEMTEWLSFILICKEILIQKYYDLPNVSHSVVPDSLPPHGLQHARLPCPSLTYGTCELMSIVLVMPSNHLILCCPLFLLPSVFTRIKVFSSESVLHIRWPKYWSFSFSISPSNEYSGLISFRIF